MDHQTELEIAMIGIGGIALVWVVWGIFFLKEYFSETPNWKKVMDSAITSAIVIFFMIILFILLTYKR